MLRPKASQAITRYTPTEAAAELGCSTRTLSKLVRDRLIGYHNAGTSTIRPRMYFTDGDIAEYRESTRVAPRETA